MKRTIKQWTNCSPEAMAKNQSEAARVFAFEDAKSDILELHRKCQKAATELASVADELKLSSTIGGEWDATEEVARKEYYKIMLLVSDLSVV